MPAIYEHLDLKTREIRLLRLKRLADEASKPWPETLDFELTSFSLDKQPDFVALSYCWGKAEATRTILVSGTAFLVRPNLHSWLQLMLRERIDYWIFIDAICINQDDFEEKNNQVSLMGDVFRDAASVVAWLGDKDDTTLAPPNWRQIFNEVATEVALEAARRAQQGLPCPGLAKADWIPSKSREALQIGVQLVTDSAYWTRSWIVQEVLLASSLTLRYGELDIDCAIFLALLDLWLPGIRGDGGLGSIAVWDLDPGSHVPTFRARWLLQDREKHGSAARNRQLTLSHLVTTYAYQECSIVHDRVYSLLGMTTSAIVPTYQRDVRTLYVYALAEGIHRLEADFASRSSSFNGKTYKDFDYAVRMYMFNLMKTLGLDLQHSAPDYLITKMVQDRFAVSPSLLENMTSYSSVAVAVQRLGIESPVSKLDQRMRSLSYRLSKFRMYVAKRLGRERFILGITTSDINDLADHAENAVTTTRNEPGGLSAVVSSRT